MVVIRMKHIVVITSAKPIFFMFNVLIFLSQTKVFIVVYLCWCYAWCGQDGQDAWSELHARHSEGRRVHIHLAQCWRHPWPCCHLPGGVEETLQVCHRHPGLLLPRSVIGKGFCDACQVWWDDYVCHFVCVPVFAWNWPVLSCPVLLDTDVLPGDDEKVMPTFPFPLQMGPTSWHSKRVTWLCWISTAGRRWWTLAGARDRTCVLTTRATSQQSVSTSCPLSLDLQKRLWYACIFMTDINKLGLIFGTKINCFRLVVFFSTNIKKFQIGYVFHDWGKLFQVGCFLVLR